MIHDGYILLNPLEPKSWAKPDLYAGLAHTDSSAEWIREIPDLLFVFAFEEPEPGKSGWWQYTGI